MEDSNIGSIDLTNVILELEENNSNKLLQPSEAWCKEKIWDNEVNKLCSQPSTPIVILNSILSTEFLSPNQDTSLLEAIELRPTFESEYRHLFPKTTTIVWSRIIKSALNFLYRRSNFVSSIENLNYKSLLPKTCELLLQSSTFYNIGQEDENIETRVWLALDSVSSGLPHYASLGASTLNWDSLENGVRKAHQQRNSEFDLPCFALILILFRLAQSCNAGLHLHEIQSQRKNKATKLARQLQAEIIDYLNSAQLLFLDFSFHQSGEIIDSHSELSSKLEKALNAQSSGGKEKHKLPDEYWAIFNEVAKTALKLDSKTQLRTSSLAEILDGFFNNAPYLELNIKWKERYARKLDWFKKEIKNKSYAPYLSKPGAPSGTDELIAEINGKLYKIYDPRFR